jgi:hypothetical protein
MLYSLGLDIGKIYELSINSMLSSFRKITYRPKSSHTTGATFTKLKIILKQIYATNNKQFEKRKSDGQYSNLGTINEILLP